MSQPVVFTFRLEIERYKRGLSRQDLADAVSGSGLRVTPQILQNMLYGSLPRPRHDDWSETAGPTVSYEQRSEILRRLARLFEMPESEAKHLLDRV